ncbi:MAG: hypothetical protein VX726_12915 [Planctomycetota bacterium]|nr:hypothetical protein [Planctomycetota bacterium]
MRASPRLFVLLVSSALLLGVAHGLDRERRHRSEIAETRLALLRIESEIRLRSALAEGPKSPSGWTMTVDPRWFGGELPRNHLSPPGSNRRIEVDRSMDQGRIDPDRIVTAADDAGWWFNPGNGVVRARVSSQSTLDRTRALYEHVNR